ncbi:hypothetical protein [Gracilimonas mengyeensis]|uniref:Uncharacterized protein n=1 Tax=Gracilimonas mengyeensis TaxID=1302730 RepID=A0A521ET30_9BACT|nr:hypothetical protein [Gracilimonas mengyeensis]SMO87064.1 hypothetical protein SAMN06265219_113125 [Gracilimonas mengyeensis]
MSYSHFNITTDHDDIFEKIKQRFFDNENNPNQVESDNNLKILEEKGIEEKNALKFLVEKSKSIDQIKIVDMLKKYDLDKLPKEDKEVVFVEIFQVGVKPTPKISLDKFLNEQFS